MVLRPTASFLLISIFIIPSLAGKSGENKEATDRSPVIRALPFIQGRRTSAISGRDVPNYQLFNTNVEDSADLDFSLDRNTKKFIHDVSNTRLVNGLVPFSGFGEAGINLISLIRNLILHNNYPRDMDEFLYPVVRNFQVVVHSAHPSVVQEANGFRLIYKFVDQYIAELTKSIDALKAKRGQFMKIKSIASNLTDVYAAVDPLVKSLSNFTHQQITQSESTKLIWNFKNHPNINLDKAETLSKGLVQSMRAINDIAEERFRFTLPLDKLTIFPDLLVVLTTLFEVVLRFANTNIILMTYRIVYEVLQIQNDSYFMVSEANKSGIFSMSLNNRKNLLKEILVLDDFVSNQCPDKSLEVYCAVLKSRTSKLFDTLSNYFIESTDGTAKNYILRNEQKKVKLEAQQISPILKSAMENISVDLQNISSPLYKNQNSMLSIHLKTLINLSMNIIEQYPQSEQFLQFFAKLQTSISELMKSGSKRSRSNAKGELQSYNNYDPKKCTEVKDNIEIFGVFFGYRVIFDNADKNAKGNFFGALKNLLEVWHMFNGKLEQGPGICAERFESDQLEEEETDNELIINNNLEQFSEEAIISQSNEKSIIGSLDNNSNKKQSSTAEVVQTARRPFKRVIILVESMDCGKCMEDRYLMKFLGENFLKKSRLV
jgi:hypothetical protein